MYNLCNYYTIRNTFKNSVNVTANASYVKLRLLSYFIEIDSTKFDNFALILAIFVKCLKILNKLI